MLKLINNLTNEIETEAQIHRLTAVGGTRGCRLGEKKVTGLSKKKKPRKTTHTHRQPYGDNQREREVGRR